MKPLVVNLFGAPGAGKSTLCSGLHFRMKNNHLVNAEITGEVAKDLTWENRYRTLQNQTYVFGRQQQRIERLTEGVDVIICDSPLLLTSIFAPAHYPDCFHEFVRWSFNQYNNMNFLLERAKPYNERGRNQTEQESDLLHGEIVDMLNRYGVEYQIIQGNEDGMEAVVRYVLERLSEDA